MFRERLKKAIIDTHNNIGLKINLDDVIEIIEKFRSDYGRLLTPIIWEEQQLELKIDEFDMLLTVYDSLYSQVSDSLLSNSIKLWADDERPFEIRVIYIFRFLIQDLIALRNFCVMKFENQFIATFRHLIEKTKILFLNIYDYDFSCDFLFNDSGYDKKEMYYELTRPTKINKRIKENYERIINEERKTGVISARLDKHIYDFLQNKTLEYAYSPSSKFVHSNDMNAILTYYNEGNKLNLSLKHNSSSYLHARLDYCIEFILLLYDHIRSSFQYRNVKQLSSQKSPLEKLLVGYFSVLVNEKY
jgi:hypothetical protein